MTRRNRLRYRNNIRLPIILFILIVGSLVGLRWIKEVRAHHLENRLSSQLRNINHEIATLSSHISDLKGRRQALLTEDALLKAMADRKLKMDPIDLSTVMHIGPVATGTQQAMTQTSAN
ncbi:MAG: hypothetical protein JNM99_03540 [Verrucomicrobiaceae bacterium]|nr:hypothetical protein [Verrucomicrobiaceae bacterium]